MKGLNTKRYDRSENFTKDFRLSLYKKGLGQDVEIVTKNGTFYGYSAILLVRSAFLATQIEQSKKIQTEYSYEAVKEALEFIYTGEFRIPSAENSKSGQNQFDLACELFSLSKKWILPEIKLRCQKYISSDLELLEITKETELENSKGIKNKALSKLDPIQKLEYEDLKEQVLKVVDKQMPSIIANRDYIHLKDTDLSMILQRNTLNISSELSLFTMIIDYACQVYDSQSDPNELTDKRKKGLRDNLLNRIRFGSMDLDSFLIVENYEILTEDENNDIADYIEMIGENNESGIETILDIYKEKDVDWFKPKRCHLDDNFAKVQKERHDTLLKDLKQLNKEIEQEDPLYVYLPYLRDKLENINLDEFKLQFVSEPKDIYTCTEFHRICDNKGPTIVLIESEGAIFGGYTSVGWITKKQINQQEAEEKKIQKKVDKQDFEIVQDDEKKPEHENQNNTSTSFFDINEPRFEKITPIEDDKAFLFILKSSDKEQQILKVIPEQKENALVYYSKRGPIFGDGWDLAISADLKNGYSDLGLTYQLPDGIRHKSRYAKSFLNNQYGEWKIQRLLVYFRDY
ncbi:btb (poz) domain-containing 2a-related [Anaeramoeba ignava]|uniref:Btb (Poz) domain-containing 2a-related n=1 Tax=Anaeramoeba ignava TaxID=1746090 RepID=A0A9Q0LTW7_ANAIG|nr:btb (poz) domain-containing 2a-related [Anaeramoeba ignava]